VQHWYWMRRTELKEHFTDVGAVDLAVVVAVKDLEAFAHVAKLCWVKLGDWITSCQGPLHSRSCGASGCWRGPRSDIIAGICPWW